MTVYDGKKNFVTTAQFFALWRAVGELSTDPAAGLKIATQIDVGNRPPSTMAAYYARDYRDALTRLARFKQLCAPEELKIKATKDERIPSRSERDRPLEIRFVEPGRLRAALQLDPFCRHKVPCAAATKFNERGKGGVC